MVKLVRVDINTEVSFLESQLELPGEGHLDSFLHIYYYLSWNYNLRLEFYPTYTTIDMYEFNECEWKDFYGDVKEAIAYDAPEARVK